MRITKEKQYNFSTFNLEERIREALHELGMPKTTCNGASWNDKISPAIATMISFSSDMGSIHLKQLDATWYWDEDNNLMLTLRVTVGGA